MNAALRLAIRRVTPSVVPCVSRLFAAAFARDPLFDWLVRPGRKRARALHEFFGWILETRMIPHGETWMTADGSAASAWVPPQAQTAAPSLVDDLRMLPALLRLTGLSRLPRAATIAAAMKDAHPKEPYRYLAFIGVEPKRQGRGLGTALLEASLAHADGMGTSAYLENSNPRNLRLYERAGFSVTREIRARPDAPPVFAMWRPARQGSSTMSQ